MLGAYFDESGTQPGDGVIVVSGYIAPASEWAKFQTAWWQTLSNAGIDPSKIAFHMTEFNSRHKPYMKDKTPFPRVAQQWSDAKADAVLGSLLGIIQQRATFSVSTAVVVKDYEEFLAETGSTLSRYAFCATRCLHQCAAKMDEFQIDGKIAYIFGDGAEGAVEVNRSVARVHASPELRKEYRMASLGFGGTLDYLPLQAADIGVWESRRYSMTVRDRTGAEMRKSLESLLSGLPHSTEYYDKAGLYRYLAELRVWVAHLEAEEAAEKLEIEKVPSSPPPRSRPRP